MKRLVENREMTQEDAENRINSQMPIDEKAKRADYVIDNNGAIDDMQAQVEKLYKEIIA